MLHKQQVGNGVIKRGQDLMNLLETVQRTFKVEHMSSLVIQSEL